MTQQRMRAVGTVAESVFVLWSRASAGCLKRGQDIDQKGEVRARGSSETPDGKLHFLQRSRWDRKP